MNSSGMNEFGLSQKTIEILKTFFSKFSDIKMVKIYGSRAIGNYRNGSDIDFALFGDFDKNSIKKISYEIDELNIPYMFDITDYSAIQNNELKEHIDRVGKVFFEKTKI